MKHILGVLLLAMLLIAPGCKDDQTTSGNAAPIDSRLNLVVIEHLAATRSMLLRAATQRIYSCSNYSLATTSSTSGQTITISFDNVNEPSVCVASQSAARGEVDLGSLAAGSFKLALHVNDVVTNAQLVVTDTSYAVTNGDGQWTTFITTSVHKVPQDVIWGSVLYNNTGQLNTYMAFRDSLKRLGAQVHQYPVGDYGFFTVVDSTIAPPAGVSSIFVNTFLFQFSGDMQAVQNLLRNYGAAYHDQFIIFLYGSHGEAYQSNLLSQGS